MNNGNKYREDLRNKSGVTSSNASLGAPIQKSGVKVRNLSAGKKDKLSSHNDSFEYTVKNLHKRQKFRNYRQYLIKQVFLP